jgi:hypothetical protein
VTVGGLAIGSLGDLLGVPIRFIPGTANAAGATTVNPSGPGGALGAITVRRASAGGLVAIAGGDFSTTVYAEIVYDGTEFVQINPATGSAPVGTELSYTGSTAPAGYLVENGVCVSQTTYAALYAAYGGTDVYSPGSTGGACAGGQFHVKFANGRASVAADTQGGVVAGVLTTAGSGCGATVVAVNCGAQNQLIAQAGLPNATIPIPSGQGSHTHVISPTAATLNSVESATSGGPVNATAGASATQAATLPAMVTSSMNGGVTQTATTTVQPTSTVLMAVKY